MFKLSFNVVEFKLTVIERKRQLENDLGLEALNKRPQRVSHGQLSL